MDLEVAEHVGECFCVNSSHVQYYVLHVQRSNRSHPDAMVGGDEGREERRRFDFKKGRERM